MPVDRKNVLSPPSTMEQWGVVKIGDFYLIGKLAKSMEYLPERQRL